MGFALRDSVLPDHDTRCNPDPSDSNMMKVVVEPPSRDAWINIMGELLLLCNEAMARAVKRSGPPSETEKVCSMQLSLTDDTEA